MNGQGRDRATGHEAEGCLEREHEWPLLRPTGGSPATEAAAGEHSGPFRLGPLKQGGAPRGGCYQSRLVGSEVVFATL